MGSALVRLALPVVVAILLAQGALGAPSTPSARAAPTPFEVLSHGPGAIAAAPSPRASVDGPSLGTASVAAVPRPSASLPTSDVVETPPPTIPLSTPTTFVIASWDNCTASGGCTPLLNVTAPAGPWSLILLNYTGRAVNGVYDSSFHATVDAVPVLFGTTPELSTWTVLKNLTEYSALFNHTATVQFVLGRAVTNGYFVINVSLAFYPAARGTPGPSVPTAIVPVLPFTGLSSTRPIASSMVTVPTDTVNATLEVYAYGFGPEDEFWYSNNPPYRAVNITADGTTLAVVQPFEYVNTGGLDLYLWDPVTGAYTLNDPPYEIDVTAALGLLEGTHVLNASVLGALYPRNTWTVGATLLLYTNASTFGAQLTSVLAPPATNQRGSNSVGATQTVTQSIRYASTFSVLGGATTVTSWTNESFQSVVALTSTSSLADVSARSTEQVRSVGPSGTRWINASSTPSLAFLTTVNSSATFTCNGNPCQNQTYTMVSFFQNWNLSRVDTELPLSGPRSVVATYANDNVSANGTYSAKIEYPSGGGALVLALYYYWSNTTKVYDSLTGIGSTALYYNHTVASALIPSDLNGQGRVRTDAVTYTDAAALSSPPATTEVGVTGSLSAGALGFGGPFTFAWSGLPPGCPSAPTTAAVVCTPSSPGTYSISVRAVSATGRSSPPTTAVWTVLPALLASLTTSAAVFDRGSSVNVTLRTSGGLGPMHCTWYQGSTPIATLDACTTTVAITSDTLGAVNVTVRVIDVLGIESDASLLVRVVDLPGVIVTIAPNPGGVVPVYDLGATVVLSAVVQGGTPPYGFSWAQNGVAIPGGGRLQNYSFSATVAGNYTFVVRVTDGDGVVVSSVGIELRVAGPSSPHGGGGGGSSNGSTASSAPGGEIVIGVALVAAVALLGLILVLRRRTPPSAPPLEEPSS